MKKNNKELIAYFLKQGFKLDFNIIQSRKSIDADNSFENDLYKKYLDNPDKMLFYFGFVDDIEKISPSIGFLHNIAVKFIKRLSKTADVEFTRENTVLMPTEDEIVDLLNSVPFVVGLEFINANWIKNIYKNLTEVFANEIKAYRGTVAEFLSEHNAKINVAGRVFFHLVENNLDAYPFAFLATYSAENSGDKKATHTPLKNALLEYKGQNDRLLKLLSTVSKAAQKSDFISELVESGELFSPLKLTSKEAYIFLKEISLYEECGILCRMPDWWKKKSNALKLSIKVGEREPAKVGMDALLNFNPELFFGEDQMTEEELRMLLAQTSGLSFIKGKWVEVDHEKLQATLEAYEKAKQLLERGECTIGEAMRMQLNAAELLDIKDDDVSIEVSNGEWLNSITSKLKNPSLIKNIAISDDFKATLRGYQKKGFDWLNYMKNLGFGACLADDMGLGKTVQIIALLEHVRLNTTGRSLLIMPASLMGNWQKEIEKFAPMIKYKMIYNNKEKIDFQKIDDTNLYITTYGMAMRLEELKTVKWDLVILDEAQAIKNPGTKQTKAIKQLEASAKIAMTGTPIENRLSDLWSLFDFLNAGLLGTAKEFTQFTQKLKDGNADYSKLREVVNPFILRRLKTDKTVIADLPEKMEMKTYATLTKKQVVLYNGLVKELKHKLETAEGIERKGLVLASIMKFKQICNHPDQFLGQNTFKYEQSGKFERLLDLCETICEKRERVLVFTQFKEMTKPIADFLETVFNRMGLILHGGTPVKKRSELVDKFCGDEYVPFMVLSLKAGGVGLNLTAANHVIHFDRWWNPAVENQATDRAFRIGQKKNVMVHKFITAGTIEEKIDKMIEEKSKLAGDIIPASGESWITEMDNKQLMELFTFVQAGEK
ncbi:DEAD/DEAH box helicase [Marinisporobacter balticus]|uniref:Non-specific serine/threonine protein kinase n=1 Tax=Marinisporobacter balticus TaxID=2018667 RepID=A0A4V2S9R7_9FIRM|nr:DEAD/DEAH box helicase [Marinisporobacter balticus]TCO68870.1 non-specific serine/threonine protein kinase [Marinisporobacter balticus]